MARGPTFLPRKLLEIEALGVGGRRGDVIIQRLSEQVVVSADLTTLRAGSGAVGEVFEGETLVTVPVVPAA